MDTTSTLRTIEATAGPTVTGVLAGLDSFWTAFVAAETLSVAYDLELWAMFVNLKLYQHEKTCLEERYEEVDIREEDNASDTEGRTRKRMI